MARKVQQDKSPVLLQFRDDQVPRPGTAAKAMKQDERFTGAIFLECQHGVFSWNIEEEPKLVPKVPRGNEAGREEHGSTRRTGDDGKG